MLPCTALPPSFVEGLKSTVDAFYSARATQGEITKLNIAPGEKFASTASSVTIGALLSEDQISTVLRTILAAEPGAHLKAQLGETVLCNRDQSWIRRQYAPSRYPPRHAPHGWHQDGALGFDFGSYPEGHYSADGLLRMVTCWIALDECGVDAPSLEFVTRPVSELLPPSDLGDARIRARFSPTDFWPVKFNPGEALLFSGDMLHRTYVTREMTRDRTSIELRFFAEVPERIKGDRFLSAKA